MSTALATTTSNGIESDFITPQQVELLKHSIMKGATDLELDLFLNLCRAKRLDPLTRQIYAIKTNQGWQNFASIDGLRVIAQRSGEYEGQAGPFWCGVDGEWTDVWLQGEPPKAAKVGVWRRGFREPTWGVATFESYGKGKGAPIWRTMPDVMLSKCAESIALRKAFPDDLSGLYVREEFGEDERSTRRPPTDRQEDLLDTAWQAREEMRKHIAAGDVDEAIAAGAIGVIASEMTQVIDAETGEIAEPLTADPGSIEEERKALWLGAQALGWEWKEFNDKRRELKLPTLGKMTFADVRAMKAGLEA